MELVFKEIILSELDKKYNSLSEFCEFYGLSVYKEEENYNYILKDNQTGELEYFGWFSALLHRISSRALDYEINEHEIKDFISVGYYNYLTSLLWVYLANSDFSGDKYEENWLREIINNIGKMEIEKESK